MSTITSRLVTAMLALFLVIYSLYHIYRYTYDPYKTEMASLYEMDTSFTARGMIFRSEKLIEGTSEEGFLNYLVADAAKVGANTVIADEYNSEQVVKLVNELALVEEELAALQDTGTGEIVILPSGDALSGQIYEHLNQVVDMTSGGLVEGTSHLKVSILQVINKRQLAIGRLTDLSNRIEQLTLRKTALEEAIGAGNRKVTAGTPGYFSRYTDGYEEDYSPDMIKTCSAEELLSMIETPGAARQRMSIGKIVADYEWSLAVSLTGDEAEKIQVGKILEVNFNESLGDGKIKMTVTKLLPVPDTNQYVLVLGSDIVNAQILSLRSTTVEIGTGVIRGIWVNSRAIRFVDGVTGVYVKKPTEIVFKPIEILYEGQGFLLCHVNYTHSTQLNLFDEIVVKGKDLYDHKLL